MKNLVMLLISVGVTIALLATLALFLRRLRRFEGERWGLATAQPTLRQILRRVRDNLRNPRQ